MGAVVTAGIGRVCDNLISVNSSYDGAREAVSYRVLYGTSRAINIGEIAPKEQEILIQPEDTKMHDLFKAIHLGVPETLEQSVRKEVEKLHNNAQTVNQYNLAIMEMVGAFYRFCANNFIDFNEFCGNVGNPYERVPEMDESTLTAWMIDSAKAISEELKMPETVHRDVWLQMRRIWCMTGIWSRISPWIQCARHLEYRILIFPVYLKKRQEKHL